MDFLRILIKLSVLIACSLMSISGSGDIALDRVSNTTRLRRPVAMQLDGDEKTLVVANRDSGSISLIDATSLNLVGEFQLGRRLSSIEYLKKADCFLATDSALHKIFCFRIGEKDGAPNAHLIWDRNTPKYPTCLKINDEETMIAVAGLWSRQVEFIHSDDWSSGRRATVSSIDLDFCPGECLWIDDQALLVAAAFGEQLAVVRTGNSSALTFRMPGHRTGGLGRYKQSIGFSDQRLNPLARSTRNDVHWGLMVSNQLRWLPVDKLLNANSSAELADLANAFSNQPVGRPEDAKADLGRFAITTNGVIVVAIGGVDELAIGRPDDDGFAFVPVGRRPVAVVTSADNKRGFVANQLDDSVSVVNLEDFATIKTVSLGPTPELDLAHHGEILFFNARLSHDGWMSCHSCHVNGHTNGMLNDNFSDQSFQTPKRVISLLGHGETLPLAWLGLHSDFESQVRASIELTMQSDEPATDEQVEAIAEFIQHLPAPESVSIARDSVNAKQLASGRNLFDSLDCVRCHEPPTYSTPATYDVGVRDENGVMKFNPPSLIGLGQQDQYFHDGRYKKLQDLFEINEHQLPRKLTDQEISDLIVFLKSL